MKTTRLTIAFILALLSVMQLRAEAPFDTDQGVVGTRIEKKVFTGITEIDIDHKYGDIFVTESNSSSVELEIQYYDGKYGNATCDVSSSNGKVSIRTTYPKTSFGILGAKGDKATINYIISVPKNTGMDISLKQGNIKVAQYSGKFAADLSYSNLTAEKFSGTNIPDISIKFGELKIQTADDLSISGSYSALKIAKAKNITLSGNYNEYQFAEVASLKTSSTSSYNDLKIGTAADVKIALDYTDVVIDNLISSLDVNCMYGDVIVKAVSNKLSIINVNSSYSDVVITLPSDLSASFDVNLIYGDFKVDSKHKVSYTEPAKDGISTKRTGVIGSKTPTAKLIIVNKYADVKFK